MNRNEAKIKPSHSLWQNIRYLFANLWRWDKKLFFLCTFRIPPMVILPFLGILMTPLVLQCLSEKASPLRLVTVVGFVSLGMIACGALDGYLRGKTSLTAMTNRLHYIIKINEKTLDTDFENLESPEGTKSREKAVRANGNDDSATEKMLTSAVTLASGVLGFLLYGGILSSLNPLIVLLLLATAAVSFLFSRRVWLFEHRNKDVRAQIDKKLWYLIQKCEDLAAGKDIRVYGMAGWFGRLFGILLKGRIRWYKRAEYRAFASGVVDGLLILLRDGAAYAYLIYLVLKGAISVPDFTLYFGTVAGFSSRIDDITGQLSQMSHMSLEVCDTREYLDLPDRSRRGAGTPLPPRDEWPCEVEFDHVTFSYPGSGKKILDDLCLTIQKGEKVALVGVNGAGKTTCVKLLCGLYRPVSGRILINGRDMLSFNRDEYSRLFAAVFQDVYVLPVSVARNIAPDASEPVNRERAARCLALSGLKEKVNAFPQGIDTLLVKEVNEGGQQLSGGELQKLLLARAIYKDAPVLILDEPTAALDPIAENELYQRYGELTRGRTSLYISHRLSSTRFCDRIVFLSGGKIAECGTHQELMRRCGQYAEMFEIQSHYYKEKVPDALCPAEEGGGF